MRSFALLLASIFSVASQAGLPPVSFGPFGNAPNASTAVCVGNRCTAEPADATHPGSIKASGSQTLGVSLLLDTFETMGSGAVTIGNISALQTILNYAGMQVNNGGVSEAFFGGATSSNRATMYNPTSGQALSLFGGGFLSYGQSSSYDSPSPAAFTVDGTNGNTTIAGTLNVQGISNLMGWTINSDLLYDPAGFVSTQTVGFPSGNEIGDGFLYEVNDDIDTLNWASTVLNATDGTGLSINWTYRVLKDSTGSNTSVDYGNRYLMDQSSVPRVDWSGNNVGQGLNIDSGSVIIGSGYFLDTISSGGILTPFISTILGTDSDGTVTSSGVSIGAGSLSYTGNLALTGNIVSNTGSGIKIGTATNEKLGFFNSTPIVKPAGDVVTNLQNLGLISSATLAINNTQFGVQAANVVLAGPSSGGSATPTWRALTVADGATGRISAIPAYLSFSANVTSIVSNQIAAYGKATTAATVVGMQGVATSFTCVSNPTFTLYDCGTSAGACTSGRTALASVTLTAANTGTDGSVSSSALAAGHYWAVEVTGGTCTSLNIVGTAQYN